MRYFMIAFVILALVTAQSAFSQTTSPHPPHIAGGANAAWIMPSGDRLDTTQDALGLDAHIGIPASRWVSFDIGVHYSHHNMPTRRPYEASLYGFYFEPRIRSPRSIGGAFPVIGVRIGWLFRDVSLASYTGYSQTDGYSIGGTGGAMFHLSGPVWVEAAATVSSIWLEPIIPRENDQQRYRGTLAAIQLGVRVPFGRGGD